MKLTAASRNKEPAKDFALPEQRKVPIPDARHAANAKARATQGVTTGTLSKADAKRVRSKADKVLKAK
jgi:hypothetical protein